MKNLEEKYNVEIKTKGFIVWFVTYIIRVLAFCPWGNKIYINKNKWFDKSLIAQESTVLHERIHIEQRIRFGKIRWIFDYALSCRLRWGYEREAYLEQIKFWIDNHFIITDEYLKNLAKSCSSFTYLWMVTEDIAYNFFKREVENYRKN